MFKYFFVCTLKHHSYVYAFGSTADTFKFAQGRDGNDCSASFCDHSAVSTWLHLNRLLSRVPTHGSGKRANALALYKV